MPVTLKLSVVLSDDLQCSTIWLAKSKGKWHAWRVDTTTPPLGEPPQPDAAIDQAVDVSPADAEPTLTPPLPVTAGPLTLA